MRISSFAPTLVLLVSMVSMAPSQARAGGFELFELLAAAASISTAPLVAPTCIIGTGAFQLPLGHSDGANPFSVVTRHQDERLTKDFVPADMAQIDHKYESPYLISSGRFDVTKFWEQMRPQAVTHLDSMLDAAALAGIPLFVHSAYRAYSVQCQVFNIKLRAEFTDPVTKQPVLPVRTEPAAIADVNTRSAFPGESEHQLGTAVDLVTNISVRNLGYALEPEMDQMPAFSWLQANAHKFGFVLSYPRGNVGPKEVNPRTGYIYEPWHWRYIGVAAAVRYHDCEKLGMTTQEFLRQLNKNAKFACVAR